MSAAERRIFTGVMTPRVIPNVPYVGISLREVRLLTTEALMHRIDIIHKSGRIGDQWEAVEDGDVVVRAHTKDQAIELTAEHALHLGIPVTVKIHNEDGQYEEERTYPRSADPEESEG